MRHKNKTLILIPIAILVTVSVLTAQVAETHSSPSVDHLSLWLSPLLNVGPIGAVLVWFMHRNERKMVLLEHAMDRMSKAVLLLVVRIGMHEDGNEEINKEARRLINEIDSRPPDPVD